MRAAAAVLLLAATAALLFAVARADEPDSGPAYRAGGSIISRAHSNGRIEFCFEAVDGQRLCPTARFLDPATARRGRWLRSSEVQWQAAVDPDRVIRPAAQPAPGTGASCETDLERMMAATWKVEAALASGTAFHIGNGRFLTAHHVIDGQPPFVALLHGDQVLPAMVLGSDPAVDMALLEAVRPDSASDIPAVAMRNPAPADVGSPVQLVGYPQGGPLTVSYGGLVSRVWEDEILTTASAAGGNSGGPMFDACGEVLGVLWAGSPDSNFSHSSAAVQAAIKRMTPRRPPLPSRLPSFLQGGDWLVWHYGREPPPMIDCSGHDGDWWVGVIEQRVGELQYALGRAAAESVSPCRWRHVAAIGWTGDISSSLGSDGAICTPRIEMSDPEEAVAAELGAWDKPVGRFRLRSVTHPIRCPGPANYSLLFDVAEPIDADLGMDAVLVATDGRTLPASPDSWTGTSTGASPRFRSISLDWNAPPGFTPAAVRVRVTHPRSAPHRFAETLQLDAAARAAAGPTLSVSLKIAVLVDPASGAVRACIERAGRPLDCPGRNLPASAPTDRSWRGTSAISWLEDLPDELAPSPNPGLALTSCAINPALPARAWQVATVRGNGTAVYVGNRQFLAPAALLTDSVPWAVISRPGDDLPAARVATDARNGLALLELIGDARPPSLGAPIPLLPLPANLEGSRAHLLSYPWGSTRRYTVSVVEMNELTARRIETEWLGWDRTGASLFDPCSGRLLGISLDSNTMIRADAASAALSGLRASRSPPVPATGAPPLHGPAAAHPAAVYYSAEQPDFGGWICNVRPSERYRVSYAVYLASLDVFDAAVVVDGNAAAARTCGWSGKVFIVEIRSDQAPAAVCAAPTEPEWFRTTVDLKLDAPPGFEIESAQEFARGSCPGADGKRWESTHYVRVRSRGSLDITEVSVRLENAAGQRFEVAGWGPPDVDPDIAGWRFNVTSGKPVKLVIEGH